MYNARKYKLFVNPLPARHEGIRLNLAPMKGIHIKNDFRASRPRVNRVRVLNVLELGQFLYCEL